ncbi:hypothetical protein BHM03_00004742 [Ensete ventricosum]|uniref:Uncharacterized protein n=1 Tax=Ensete ventricosum TaxID=4639 RepID=A0A445MAZ0_ENSVE|nr:hypothetical protein BHM03_00004742 [Ensete ventricosum]
MDAKALKALEVMKSCHDFNSIVTEGSLAVIRERYNILEYTLHAPLPGQCPYSKGSLGFSVSVDALEAGLRLSLHPIIEECLKGGIRLGRVVEGDHVLFSGDPRLTELWLVEAGLSPTPWGMHFTPLCLKSRMNDTYCSLVDAYKQVKDLRARGRKMEDDLLKAVWKLEMLPEEGGGGVQGDDWVQAGNPTDHPGLI